MLIPLAIAMQVVSSFLFASGAILQSLGVKSTFDPTGRASSNKLTIGGLLRLFKIPKWLLGLVLVFSGAAIHLVALSFAPVTVVQPVGILAVPWSVLLAAKIHRHQLGARLWSSVGITVLGVVGFTIFSSLFTSEVEKPQFVPMAISFGIACVVCAALSAVAVKAPPWAKAMVWSSVGAIFYGLASGFMKAAMVLLKQPDVHWTQWEFLVTVAMMVACYALGVWMIQQGYASGPAEITVGTMTTVDPFVAVLFGLIVLGEGSRMGPLPAVAMAFFGGVAVYGVMRLSKDHPDAVEERRQHDEDTALASD